jgi:hypothetical protein
VFRTGREPWFDPVSVGVGQKLTQGTAGGVAVVALLCWREVRLRRTDILATPADGPPAESQSTARQVLLIAGAALALGLCLCSGVVLGLLGGARGAYHHRFLEEQEDIAPVLASDQAFAGVELREYSAGGVYLAGEVPSAEDLGRLRAGVVRAVGERRAREALRAVSVRP